MPARLWYVYVVRCRDGSLYTGVSTDVDARVRAHNAGRGARYTRARGPVVLVHVEGGQTRGAALSREAAVKSLRRAQKLALITAVAGLMVIVNPLVVRAADSTPKDATSASRPSRVRIDRVRIPGGPFRQGSTRGEEDERPERVTRVATFSIDRTEVTRADYGRCVAARRCPRPPAFQAAAEGTPEAMLPVTGVNWAEAGAYCAFARGRLPTEAEWEKAARGTDGREHPWGPEPDCSRGNWGNFDGEGPCAGQNPGRPMPVGSFPSGASPFGVLDLGGNVWEWVSDRYDQDRTRRVVRGGSCCSYFVGARSTNRNAWSPDHRDGDLGFRCAGG